MKNLTEQELITEDHVNLQLRGNGIRNTNSRNLISKGYFTKQSLKQLLASPPIISPHRKNIGQKLALKTLTDWKRFANAFEL